MRRDLQGWAPCHCHKRPTVHRQLADTPDDVIVEFLPQRMGDREGGLPENRIQPGLYVR